MHTLYIMYPHPPVGPMAGTSRNAEVPRPGASRPPPSWGDSRAAAAR